MTKLQAERLLSTIITQSWNRVRSSNELQALISRRELALAEADLDA